MRKKITEKSCFKYVVIGGIILIPFIYAFFYLKAYWDPYGKGNMDNIPVAIVNEDKGSRGDTLTKKIIDSKALKFTKENKEDASDGLNNKKYYAVITIPENFTSSLESAKQEDKTPATITYSPNQKTNYLASQIISRVLLTVEKELRAEVSSEVVNNLSEKLEEVPKKLDEVAEGTKKLEDGSKTLSDGLNTLSNKYTLFDNGIQTLYTGSETLNNGLQQVQNGVDELQNGSHNLNNGLKQINDALSKTDTSSLQALTSGIESLKNGSDTLNYSLNQYVTGSENLAGGVQSLDQSLQGMKTMYMNLYNQTEDINQKTQYYIIMSTLEGIINNEGYKQLQAGANQMLDTSTYGVTGGTMLKSGMNTLNQGTTTLYNNTSNIQTLGNGITSLKENLTKVESGTNTLASGVDTLKNGNEKILNGSTDLTNGLLTLRNSSQEVKSGINQLSIGSTELTNGISTLKTSVEDGNNSTKTELKKLKDLNKFTANPVKIKEKDVNKVDSYGTAFAPFFMSIALWVGSLMLFIILYYDADDRFKIFSRNADNKVKRTFAYLGLATVQGIVLGILLLIGLDLHITNYILYFISLILVACLFESIMEFFIVHFGDIGKFFALILLVLQLAAAGGTFPIETVTKGFRFLNPFLPMKYTCDLFKESVMTIEGNLLSNTITIIIIVLMVLTGINLFKSFKEEK